MSTLHFLLKASSILFLPSLTLLNARRMEIPLIYSIESITSSSPAFCITDEYFSAFCAIIPSKNAPRIIVIKEIIPTGIQNINSITVIPKA